MTLDLSTLGIHRRRRRLFEKQRGQCHWCGRRMSMEPDGSVPKVIRTSATFDHVHPRGHPERLREQEYGRYYVVLACYACNQRRNSQFQKAVAPAAQPTPEPDNTC